jgi:hypothetical protein
MSKTFLRTLSLLMLLATCCAAQSADGSKDVCGFWKIIDDESGRLRSIIALYQHQDKLYGRLVITFDEQEQVKNTIYAPVERATALPEQPFFAGLDIVWDLQWEANRGRWGKGKILDPKKGKVYSSHLSWDDKKQQLVVRGKIGPFGRNQFWLRTEDKDFPADFVLPDTSSWTPQIPRT